MANQISTIERHPNRQAIISKLLAGIPASRIAAEYKVSAQALGRFKRNTLQKIVLSPKAAESVSVTPQTVSDLTQMRSNAQSLITSVSTAALLERKFERYQTMLGRAADSGDLKAWASIDRSETSALQLRAQLAGELAPQVAGNVQVAILIPSPAAMQDMGQVIEVDARQGALALDDSGGSDGDNSGD